MRDSPLKLAKSPIVEAVLDIDCDLPPTFNLANLETQSRTAFGPEYPKSRAVYLDEHKIETKLNQPPIYKAKHAIQAIQLLHADEKQLVQFRANGFSFNRLAPYSTLDDYLPDMERAWRLFVSLCSPVQIRLIRLRYINRILLPLAENGLDLDSYLEIGPRLPDQETLTFVGFLNQHHVVEKNSGNHANIVLTSESQQNSMLPIIFDISAVSAGLAEPENWPKIHTKINELRNLNNRIFWNTLTKRCLNLFQQSEPAA